VCASEVGISSVDATIEIVNSVTSMLIFTLFDLECIFYSPKFGGSDYNSV